MLSRSLRLRKVIRYTGIFAASTVVGLTTVGVGILVHDVFTYRDKHSDRVPLYPLALSPTRLGPKNLPVAAVRADDPDQKPRLIIVGGGWGAMGVLQKLHPGDYHVTLVSADTFNTFTPLLPSAAVGTVSVGSLIEPLRKLVARVRGHFIQGKAVDLVMSERLLEVETQAPDGTKHNIYLPYDKIVIAVGSTSSTHGVPGLENCYQLKTISDAQAIRRRILDNFETASLPTTTPEERKRLLSFVICGGGPTGVETAAEIFDFCQEDIAKYYSEAISKFAEDKFKRDDINLVTSARVAAVTPTHVLYTARNPETGQTTQHSIPTNFVLWSTGIAMNPFTARVSSLLPNQVHKKAIEVDWHLRVKGAPSGEVYAIGDCSTVETSLMDHFLSLVAECDTDKNGKIEFGEWEVMVSKIKQRIPLASDHLVKVKELFELYDLNSDKALTLSELFELLDDVGRRITSLPATAQVASQQGKYLGRKLHLTARKRDQNPELAKEAQRPVAASIGAEPTTPGTLISHRLASLKASPTSTISPSTTPTAPHPLSDESISKPFKYSHLGSLAYIGNAAVFDFGGSDRWSFAGGLAAMYAWRSIYWNEQVSSRTRAMLMIDWIVRGIWGRDLSRT